jgi:16S rRNA (cytidine1402-2'-O)-methyltransferase
MPSGPAEPPPPAPVGTGTLYVVATPIGNLGDLSPRAAGVLERAPCVAAEDTRRARNLLSHVGADKKELVRLDANAPDRDIQRLADRLAEGLDVALVTDAGTPVVSDPGAALVRAARARGVTIVPIAGPSAVTAALSASGYETSAFRFVGFLPRSGPDRAAALGRLAADADVVILFEAPHRMNETLADLARVAGTRRALVARELTKLHEELLEGELAALARDHAAREWLGEITIVLAPWKPDAAEARVSDEDLDLRIDAMLAEGRRAKEIAELIALETGLPKRELYERVTARKTARDAR